MSNLATEEQSQKEPPKENETPNETPHEKPKETPHEKPKETPNEKPKENPEQNAIIEKKEKEYILFRIKNKIYSLNKEDIPESGMLRTIYDDNEKEETICEVKEEFTPYLVNFVFNCIRKDKILLGQPTNKLTVDREGYKDLIKISRFFQIDEKIIMDSIELHWIHRYLFTQTNVSPTIINIFTGFVNETPLLSIVMKEKSYIIRDFNINVRKLVGDDQEYESVVFVLDKKEFILMNFNKIYRLYVDLQFITNLEPKPRSVTYDSVNINFTIE
jgi:hypothetical protein